MLTFFTISLLCDSQLFIYIHQAFISLSVVVKNVRNVTVEKWQAHDATKFLGQIYAAKNTNVALGQEDLKYLCERDIFQS